MKYKTPPAWSFPSQKNSIQGLMTPGPGSYTVTSKISPSSPSFSIGKSKRIDISLSKHSVGPGSYTPSKKFSSASAIFGSSPKNSLIRQNSTPGVGQYEIQLPVEGARYSIKGRYSDYCRSSTPGPGHYHYPISHESTGFKFGREIKIKKNTNQLPGPGTYEILPRNDSKGVVFGKEKRKFSENCEVPGPGSYEIPSTKDPKAFTISGKNHSNSNENSPGPAKYFTPLRPSPSVKIGKSKRFLEKFEKIPGPGAYELQSEKSPNGYVFDKDKRYHESSHLSVPGPGQYEIPQKIVEGPIFSIRNKPCDKIKDETPGPGAYDVSESPVPKKKYFKSNSVSRNKN